VIGYQINTINYVGRRPESLKVAGANTKAVLEEIIQSGAQQGIFAPSPKDKEQLEIAVLSAWSAMHGLTMLAIDGLAAIPRLTPERLAEKVAQMFTHGLMRR
jgi:hypothetical protein